MKLAWEHAAERALVRSLSLACCPRRRFHKIATLRLLVDADVDTTLAFTEGQVLCGTLIAQVSARRLSEENLRRTNSCTRAGSGAPHVPSERGGPRHLLVVARCCTCCLTGQGRKSLDGIDDGIAPRELAKTWDQCAIAGHLQVGGVLLCVTGAGFHRVVKRVVLPLGDSLGGVCRAAMLLQLMVSSCSSSAAARQG